MIVHSSRASGEPFSEELFVFLDEVLELSVLSRNTVKSFDVELSESFNVDWSTVLGINHVGSGVDKL